MAPCENNPDCKNLGCPVSNSKKVKIKNAPRSEKRVGVRENPENANQKTPVWRFSKCDKAGPWAFSEKNLGSDFWSKVFPRLQALETQTWNEILVKSKKHHHSISVANLNKCAQDRLNDLRLNSVEELISIKIEGNIRIYGLREIEKFVMLWYDNDHGNNGDCVCRSKLKHT